MSNLKDLLNKLISKVNSSVKVEPQQLTDEQKAQVRTNLGISDVVPVSSWNDLEDKPFGEEPAFEPLVWNGNTEGLEVLVAGNFQFVKISDYIPITNSEQLGGMLVKLSSPDGENVEQTLPASTFKIGDNGYHCEIYIVGSDGQYDIGLDTVFPKGIWAIDFSQLGAELIELTLIPGVIITSLDSKFLPNHAMSECLFVHLNDTVESEPRIDETKGTTLEDVLSAIENRDKLIIFEDTNGRIFWQVENPNFTSDAINKYIPIVGFYHSLYAASGESYLAGITFGVFYYAGDDVGKVVQTDRFGLTSSGIPAYLDTQIGKQNTIYSRNVFARDNTFEKGIVVKSSTEGSTKKFNLSVDDSGTITATEVTA